MINSKNLEFISDLFMVQGRHNRVSLIFISQMGFRTDQAFKSISNNTNYLVLMKNNRNLSDVLNLAKQMTPGRSPLMLRIYRESTKDPYSYLFINFTNEVSNEAKYLSALFDTDHVVNTFVPT